MELPSFKRLLVLGGCALAVGFLGAIGWDVYFTGKEILKASILQVQVPLHWLIFGGIGLVGVVLLVLALIVSIRSKFGATGLRESEIKKPTTKEIPPTPNDKAMQGIKLYRTPSELPPLSDFFSPAKVRINILAIDAGIILKENYYLVRAMLTNGITMRFVLLDQNSKLLDDIGKAWSMEDARKSLNESLSKLCLLKKGLPVGLKSNLEIRFFDFLPIHSMIIIDPESENAQMQVTHYKYDTHSWTSLIFSKKEQPDLFERYWESYRFAEREPREYQCPSTK